MSIEMVTDMMQEGLLVVLKTAAPRIVGNWSCNQYFSDCNIDTGADIDFCAQNCWDVCLPHDSRSLDVKQYDHIYD